MIDNMMSFVMAGIILLSLIKYISLNVLILVLSYLYLTQPNLYLPLFGEEMPSQEELHTAVAVTDHQDLGTSLSRTTNRVISF